jgi:integrase
VGPLSQLPFDQAAANYLAERRRRRLSPKTLQVDQERLVPLLRYFGERTLGSITAEDVGRFQQHRRAALEASSRSVNRGGRTINMELGILRRILKSAGLWEPMREQVLLEPQESDAGRVITKQEKEHLFALAKANRRQLHAYCAALIASNTTCRKVELRHVRRSDVDWDNHLLTVRVTKGRTAGRRRIPLNDLALEGFRELFAWGEKRGFTQPDDWIFPGREFGTHRRIHSRPVNSWRTVWRSLTRAAGLPGLRFHDLRHQAVTELRESGVPDAVVMALSGHKSTAMLDRYSHARLEAMRQAVEGLNAPTASVSPDLVRAAKAVGAFGARSDGAGAIGASELAELFDLLARALKNRNGGNS